MAGGYSILNVLNNSTRQQAEDKPGGRFRTKDINITDIYPNGRNFYAMQDIEALAEDIKAVGLLENLTVTYCPDNNSGRNYKLLGGERRWRALNLLVEQGNNEFTVATCQIRQTESERAEMIEIIMCNRQRVKTVWEQIEEERQLKETLQDMKAAGEKLKGYDLDNGRLRDTVAAILKYSAAKVGQMETIANNLRPELQEALKQEKINFSTAYTVAKMDEAGQQAALEAYEENGALNSAQAKAAAEQIPGQDSIENPQEYLPDNYGNNQLNVESICYQCTHWDDCYQKSDTTVKCATFENKRKPAEQQATEQPKEQTKKEEQPQARVIDGSTGEVFENMAEAAQAGAGQPETPKDGKKYVRVSKSRLEEIREGNRPYIIEKNPNGYKVGDTLVLQAFADGRNNGEQLEVVIVCKDDESTATAITDGYGILGIKPAEVG